MLAGPRVAVAPTRPGRPIGRALLLAVFALVLLALVAPTLAGQRSHPVFVAHGLAATDTPRTDGLRTPSAPVVVAYATLADQAPLGVPTLRLLAVVLALVAGVSSLAGARRARPAVERSRPARSLGVHSATLRGPPAPSHP